MKLLDGFSWFLNPVWIMDKFFTLWGGGSGNTTSTGTTYTTNVPTYMQPYFEQTMKSAAKNVYETDKAGNVIGVKQWQDYIDPTTGKPGERVAGFNDEQKAIQNQYQALVDSGKFDEANQLMSQAGSYGSDLAKQGFNQALAYKPEDYQARMFTGDALKDYMSPYQQSVTDMALRENNRQAAQQQKNAMLGALGRGAGGGGRSALMQSELLREQMQNASDIQSKGSQAAFENAQKQFNADEAARLAGYNARTGARQYAAGLGRDIGSAGLQTQVAGAKGIADIAAAQQTSKLERLKAQASSAAEKQAIQQKIDDVNYQTAMEKRDWEKKQLEWINSMIHGTQGLASTQVQYGPGASPLAGLGLGLSGLSLLKGLG
jgi:hypothetical protein